MGLSDHDQQAVRQITTELAGPEARVLLFGSRTRNDLRGGDIDLLVERPAITPERWALSDRLGAKKQRAMGLRKIDFLVVDPATPSSPVLMAAGRDGIALPPLQNNCRLHRPTPGGGDEGRTWLDTGRHSRTRRWRGCCRRKARRWKWRRATSYYSKF